jgi:hypothetical protein
VLITPSAWGSQLPGYNHHQLHASHQAATLRNFSWIDAGSLRVFPSKGIYRRKGDVRGHPGGPYHQVAQPGVTRTTLWCGQPLALLRLYFGLRLRVGKNRRFGFCFVQFREYFLCNFFEIQKQQKIGTDTMASC